MKTVKIFPCRGAWVAQSVKHQALSQVMISQFVGLSPTSSSALTVQNLLGILSLSPSLSVPPQLVLSLSLSKTNKLLKIYIYFQVNKNIKFIASRPTLHIADLHIDLHIAEFRYNLIQDTILSISFA